MQDKILRLVLVPLFFLKLSFCLRFWFVHVLKKKWGFIRVKTLYQIGNKINGIVLVMKNISHEKCNFDGQFKR